MEKIITSFSSIAPHLTHPFVLVGLCLCLLFGLAFLLVKKGIIPTLTKNQGGSILNRILMYGFLIAVLLIISGVILDFTKNKNGIIRTDVKQVAENFIKHSVKDFEKREKIYQREIDTLSKMVLTLIVQKEKGYNEDVIDRAIAALNLGSSKEAEKIFLDIFEKKLAEGEKANKIAAKIAENLGGLLFYSDTEKSISYYKNSLELDKNNAEVSYQLALLLFRKGSIKKSSEIFNALSKNRVRMSKINKVSDIDDTLPKDFVTALNSMYMLSDIAVMQGDFAQAKNYICDARELITKNCIDCDFGEIKKKEDTEESLKLNLKKTLESNDKDKIIYAYEKLASHFNEKKKYDKSIEMYRKGLSLLENSKNVIKTSRFNMLLGDAFYYKNNIMISERYYRDAFRVRKTLNDKQGMFQMYIRMGNIKFAYSWFIGAEDLYKRALNVSSEIGYIFGIAHSYKSLINVYQEIKNTNKEKNIQNKLNDLLEGRTEEEARCLLP